MLPAQVIETHISVVFFVGDRAYKLKKPVAFPFADLTTREAREALCHREVELNSRLAPDVYLGVADITGPDGEPCDHLVVMRRMPPERRLSALVRDHDPGLADVLADVAGQLASLHAGADRSSIIDGDGTLEAVAARWRENFEALEMAATSLLDPAQVARAEDLTVAFLAGRDRLFAERIDTGQICDGHGDVQADDVFCLPDGARILDCIEFCDSFRYGDVANDVAFLAMDLERLGSRPVAEQFLAAYEQAAGTPLPRSLVSFYVAYRAQVRAKVACLRAEQELPGSPEHEQTVAGARELLALCLRHLEEITVRLVVVGGLPGTGKSTVARGLGEGLGYTVLRSDVIRKELADLPPSEPADAPFDEGLYSPQTTDLVYRTMLERAEHHLERGESVVLDASFHSDRHRQLARASAERSSSRLVELRCVLDSGQAAARLTQRRLTADDASDADPTVAAAMAERFDPWPEAVELATDAPAGDVTRDATRTVVGTFAPPPPLPVP